MREITVLPHPDLNGDVVYAVQVGDFVKIGWAKASRLQNRLKVLQTGCPQAYDLLGVIYVAKYAGVRLEGHLHRQLRRYHYRGEWFRWSPEMRDVLAEMGVRGPRRPPLRSTTRNGAPLLPIRGDGAA